MSGDGHYCRADRRICALAVQLSGSHQPRVTATHLARRRRVCTAANPLHASVRPGSRHPAASAWWLLLPALALRPAMSPWEKLLHPALLRNRMGELQQLDSARPGARARAAGWQVHIFTAGSTELIQQQLPRRGGSCAGRAVCVPGGARGSSRRARA